MTREELIKLDEEMLAAFAAADVDLILSFLADDVHITDYGFEPVTGKKKARAYLEDQLKSFSDSAFHTVKRLVDDNQLFAEIEWTAANSGDLEMPDGTTIPATGQEIHVTFAYYAKVNRDGKVSEMRSYPDVASMMGQLGLMP